MKATIKSFVPEAASVSAGSKSRRFVQLSSSVSEEAPPDSEPTSHTFHWMFQSGLFVVHISTPQSIIL